ncbi:MAG: DUF4169 family protein [Xanthomonadales bacterium]|nr:DUF4169 family protein [Xanthomonadales bacterium]
MRGTGSGKPVNLRQWRKRRKREAARQDADANAARHGQSAAVRRLHEVRRYKAERDLDGHKLIPARVDCGPSSDVPASSRDLDDLGSAARGPRSSPGHRKKPDGDADG